MSPSGRMQGKVSIVTGSSSGLGRAIALAYAKEGALLVCADLKPNARAEVPDEAAINTHDSIKEQGGEAIFVKTDVGVAAEMKNLVEKAVEHYGRVDVLVNNAGISVEAGRAPARIHETEESDWDLTMRVNVKSVYLGCRFVIEQMLRQDPHRSGHGGWIINISSIYGLVGGQFNPAYAASKAAVANLTRQIGIDYGAEKIHCNAICPGYTDTAIFVNTTKNMQSYDEIAAQHPLGGIGRPSDIVGAAVFLASEDASWITGVCLPVDGGFTAR